MVMIWGSKTLINLSDGVAAALIGKLRDLTLLCKASRIFSFLFLFANPHATECLENTCHTAYGVAYQSRRLSMTTTDFECYWAFD